MTDTARDFEQEWQDLSEKEILMGILTELQQLRLTIQDAEAGAQGQSDGMYVCTRCEAHVPKADRASHAMSQHKAPQSMVDQLFREVT